MEIMNLVLIMSIVLTVCIIIMLFAFLRFKEEQTIKQSKIKDCLKQYFEKYTNCQLVELEVKIQSSEDKSGFPLYILLLAVAILYLVYIPIKSFGFTESVEDLILMYTTICLTFIPGAILFTKMPAIKKIKLNNNVIELHNNKGELKIYKLDETNIRYNILTGSKGNMFINIYFNEDKYTSYMYGYHRYEPYIAFIILVNLLKRNEIEKINKLDNYDIKILQQDFTYSKNKQY